jgi:hypothetical protein
MAASPLMLVEVATVDMAEEKTLTLWFSCV